ncbi:hypothetical protein DPEC_G00169920 [Dallia pectoralis]|uniref:Uncharacterized protein n=1 Tax=Dallia pectoralis TaxID=75939 RepID=A0ACC2GCV7_DALPE|nr:hypothetical protein DPEC_G00169920 [Dallia pectoralis]
MRKLQSVSLIVLYAAVCVMAFESTIRRKEGETVCIQCPHDSGWQNYEKIFIKGFSQNDAFVMKTIEDQRSVQTGDGKYYLYDDRERSIFTVTISKVTPQDADTYMCLIKAMLSGFLSDSVTLVHLIVDPAPPPPSPPSRPPSSPSRPLLSTTQPSTDSSNSITGTPVVIMVCVCLAVLMLGLILLLIYKWRKHRKSSGPVNHPVSSTEDSAYYNLTVVTQDSAYQTLNTTHQDSTYQTRNA